MTTRIDSVSLANGATELALVQSSGPVTVGLTLSAYPSAGTVTLDYRPPGANYWLPAYQLTAARFDGPKRVTIPGPATAIRITQAGIVGGTGPITVASSEGVDAIPEGSFVGLRALTTQNYTEANIKNGVQFEFSSLIPALAAAANSDAIFITGAKPVIVKSRMISFDGLGVTVRVYRAPTYTGGTPQALFNLNDRNPVAATAQILAGATVTVAGTEFGAPNFLLGSNDPGSGSMASPYAAVGGERVLRPNTTYLLRITSVDAAAQRVATYLTWYEGGTDLPA